MTVLAPVAVKNRLRASSAPVVPVPKKGSSTTSPFIVSWPGTITPGICAQRIIGMDKLLMLMALDEVKAGLLFDKMLELKLDYWQTALEEVGEHFRAMLIDGENTLVSDPDVNLIRNSLESLDHLVVIDIFLTETAELAEVSDPNLVYTLMESLRDEHIFQWHEETEEANAEGDP